MNYLNYGDAIYEIKNGKIMSKRIVSYIDDETAHAQGLVFHRKYVEKLVTTIGSQQKWINTKFMKDDTLESEYKRREKVMSIEAFHEWNDLNDIQLDTILLIIKNSKQ